MTGTGLPFSNPQGAELLQPLPGWHGFKNLKDQININLFQYPTDNLSQEMNNQAFINSNNYGNHQPVDNSYSQQQVDNSYSQQQSIRMMQQSTSTPILRKEEFPGPLNFHLLLDYQNTGKHLVYSEKLSKVFIHMEEVLPLQFQWTPPTAGLWWIRATMVYKLDQHRSQPVTRCHNHMAPDNNSNLNIDPKHLKHVIRCLHNASAYDENHTNGHLSVLVPLGTTVAGVNNVPMDFIFFCKNSCTSGMNRRATEVIFTLENDQGQILGRRKLEVRVCSCPKRDKEKEENEVDNTSKIVTGKKRKLMSSDTAPPPPPPGKKIALDNTVYELNLNIVGRENVEAIMKYAYDVMAGSAFKSGNYESYKPYMNDILKKLPE